MSCKSKGLSNEIIKHPTTEYIVQNPKLTQNYYFNYFNIPKFGIKFEASCLKAFAKPYTPNEIISFYIVYETKYGYSIIPVNFQWEVLYLGQLS